MAGGTGCGEYICISGKHCEPAAAEQLASQWGWAERRHWGVAVGVWQLSRTVVATAT